MHLSKNPNIIHGKKDEEFVFNKRFIDSFGNPYFVRKKPTKKISRKSKWAT